MNTDKIMQYFFIIAAVISILDGALRANEQMQAAKFVVLIISGIAVGVVCHHKQKDFMISSFIVVTIGYILTQLLGYLLFVQGLGLMLLNFVVFLAAASITVAFQILGDSISPNIERKKTNDMNRLKKLSNDEINHLAFQKTWGTVILIAVAITFILLLAELFFDISQYAQLFLVADIIITLLFIVDLVILYREAGNFKTFIGRNIFDILAVIPFWGVFRAIKIVRAVRLVKALRNSIKVSKVLKASKTAKLFSEESYFNSVEKNNRLLKAAVRSKKSKSSKTKTAKSSTKKRSAKKSKKKTASKKKR